jgi:hypothetical protein
VASTARNVRVDDALWEAAKAAAASEGTTASAVMVAALVDLVQRAGLDQVPHVAGEQPLF